MTSTPDPMTAPELWATLGEEAGAALVNLFHRLREVGASDAELRRALSMLVVAQNTHAGAQGEGLAWTQLRSWGVTPAEPIPLDTLSLRLDRDRLSSAVGTVLERMDPADLAAAAAIAATALHRLGKAEAVTAGQTAYREAMVSSEDVAGWTRDLEPDACELCIYWYASGREWTKTKTMPKHTGCVCAQSFHQA